MTSVSTAIETPPPAPVALARTRRRRFNGDAVLRALTGGAAAVILAMLLALVGVLTWAAMPSIRHFGFAFLVGTDWRPNAVERPLRDERGKLVRDADGETVMETLPESYGALNVIYGT